MGSDLRESSQMFPPHGSVLLLVSALLITVVPTHPASLSPSGRETFLFSPGDQQDLGMEGPIFIQRRNTLKSRIRMLKKRGTPMGIGGKIRILKLSPIDYFESQ